MRPQVCSDLPALCAVEVTGGQITRITCDCTESQLTNGRHLLHFRCRGKQEVHTWLSQLSGMPQSRTLTQDTSLLFNHIALTHSSPTQLVHAAHTHSSHTQLSHSSYTRLSHIALTHNSHTWHSRTAPTHIPHTQLSHIALIHSSHT